MNGKVKFFNDMKGFGFIAADDGTECFVHSSMIKPGVSLKENDLVTFEIADMFFVGKRVMRPVQDRDVRLGVLQTSRPSTRNGLTKPGAIA